VQFSKCNKIKPKSYYNLILKKHIFDALTAINLVLPLAVKHHETEINTEIFG